jgi:demethylmenaquinone methyltransferase/2-methoxy-6-polyprenyl-1,4-benzoquinol methylase
MMPEQAEQVRGIFTAIAGGYDRFNDVASLGIDRLWRREAVRRACGAPGLHVLDLAAGTGDLSLALARHGKAARVVACDFTPAMLARAKQKGRGIEVLDYALGDALRLPFRDESFDAATIAFGVRNLTDRPAGYRELLRVLKPGGRCVVLELTRPPNAPVRALYRVYRRHLLPLLGMVIAGGRDPYDYLDRTVEGFPPPEALAGELRAAGFASVEHVTMTLGIAAIHVAARAA